MVESEPPIVGLNVSLPNLLAVDGEASHLAISGHDPEVIAVGDRRRRAGVLRPKELVSTVNLLLPQDQTVLALESDEKDSVVTRLSRTTPAASIGIQAGKSFFR